MTAVPKVATQLGELELAAVLRDSHNAVFGEFPGPGRLSGGWAHVAHENARGKAIWDHNLGNITVGPTAGTFYVIPCRERVKRDPDVWELREMHFAAPEDFIAGGVLYWQTMLAHFESVLGFFDREDMRGAAGRLSDDRYMTAPAGPYGDGLAWLQRYALERVLPRL